MKITKNFTVIRNELLDESQLSISARYLFLLLLRFSGQDDTCYPGQKKLAKIMNLSDRQIRNLLKELIISELVFKHRSGFNRSNTYTVSKAYRKYISPPANQISKKQVASVHLGSKYPLHSGSEIPSKSTYRKESDKKMSQKGFERLGETIKKYKIKGE